MNYVCEDINECAESEQLCPFSSTCRNFDAGYSCDCDDGLALKSGRKFIILDQPA